MLSLRGQKQALVFAAQLQHGQFQLRPRTGVVELSLDGSGTLISEDQC